MQGTGIGDRTVAVLGGTGEQDRGLGRRLTHAGAVASDVVVVAVPWQGHRDLLASLAGRGRLGRR